MVLMNLVILTLTPTHIHRDLSDSNTKPAADSTAHSAINAGHQKDSYKKNLFFWRQKSDKKFDESVPTLPEIQGLSNFAMPI